VVVGSPIHGSVDKKERVRRVRLQEVLWVVENTSVISIIKPKKHFKGDPGPPIYKVIYN